MRLLSLAAAALNQTPLDWEGNRRRIISAVHSARDQGVDILCLPELCITGYNCEDMFFAHYVADRAIEELIQLAKECTKIIAVVGLPVRIGENVYNGAATIVDGKIAGITAKKFLSSEGIHYESRWFTPWPIGEMAFIDCGGSKVPFGDVWYDIDGVRIGLEICHDAWVPNRHGQDLVRRGVDIILNPSVSHFSLGKRKIVESLCLTGAQEFGVAYVFANLVGCEAGRAIYGGDTIVVAQGKIVASGSRFSFADVNLTVAKVDIDSIKKARGKLEFMDAKKFKPISVQNFKLNGRDGVANKPLQAREAWESSPQTAQFEEFTRAVALGLFDYMRKSRSKGFVISLSGGADSAAIACLIKISFDIAKQTLSGAELNSKLSFIPKLKSMASDDKLTANLLTCVYQAAENSSSETLQSAKAVAEGIGAKFFEINIAKIVDDYVELVGTALKKKFNWDNDDIALQNIQARTRSPSIWLIANALGALLVTTSNRSEASVGYATMDGDTSGGLCPIGGIDKAFLRRWLVWLEKQGPHGLAPIPALAAVNKLLPTAELRPAESKQTDEGDLMPYDVLDRIERHAIRNKLPPTAVFERIKDEFGTKFPKDQLSNWVKKFFKLWSASQWKRERVAPSFHIDDYNVDPRSWCRFPILSGGFEAELVELDKVK